MEVDIQSRHFTLTAGLRAAVRRRLSTVVAGAGRQVRRVTVCLSDINGRRGGPDKRCLVEIRLKGAKVVVIEEVRDDLYQAIDRAAKRARRSVARRLLQDGNRRRALPTRALAVADGGTA